MKLIAKLVFLLGVIPFLVSDDINIIEKECHDNFCLESDYNSDNRPPRDDSQPVIVDMQYEIDNIISVNDDLKVIGIQVSLEQTWMDNRISAKNESLVDDGRMMSAPRHLYEDPNNLPMVWIPQLWFIDMTSILRFEEQSYLYLSRANKSLGHHDADLLERHSSSAESGYFLIYYTQFDVYVKCNMNYQRFPFDRHLCKVKISSPEYNANEVKFTTTPVPAWRHNKKQNTKYFDVNIVPSESYENQSIYKNTTYSVTGFKLNLIRRYTEYLWNYMLPAALCVVVSCISFLIPSDMKEARVAILITMLLVQVTVFSSLVEGTRSSDSGLTAIEIWMVSMIVLVFVALWGYSVTLFLKRRKNMKEEQEKIEGLNKNKSLVIKDDSKLNGIDNGVMDRLKNKNINIEHQFDFELYSIRNSDINPEFHVLQMFEDEDQSKEDGMTPRNYLDSRNDINSLESHFEYNIDLMFLVVLSVLFVVYVIIYFVIYLVYPYYDNLCHELELTCET